MTRLNSTISETEQIHRERFSFHFFSGFVRDEFSSVLESHSNSQSLRAVFKLSAIIEYLRIFIFPSHLCELMEIPKNSVKAFSNKTPRRWWLKLVRRRFLQDVLKGEKMICEEKTSENCEKEKIDEFWWRKKRRWFYSGSKTRRRIDSKHIWGDFLEKSFNMKFWWLGNLWSIYWREAEKQ